MLIDTTQYRGSVRIINNRDFVSRLKFSNFIDHVQGNTLNFLIPFYHRDFFDLPKILKLYEVWKVEVKWQVKLRFERPIFVKGEYPLLHDF